MCKFCEEFNGDSRNREDRATVDLFLGGDNRYELFVTHSVDDEHDCFLTVIDNKDGNSVVSITINFCPVCGRKLSEGVCGSQQS